MIYVGIDIAKEKHFASIVSSTGEVLVAAFPFYNSSKGFLFFLDKLKDFDLSDCLFGMESTGHYAENLIFFLNNQSLNIGIINPIQTNALRKANIRKTKTDKIDTLLIAECLRLGHYSKFTKVDINILYLKYLTRFRTKLVQTKTKLKNQLTACIDQIFPELTTIFKSIHSKTCYSLLVDYSTPKLISKVRIDKLTNILNNSSRGRFGNELALSLKNIAKNSIGVDNIALSIQVKHSINQINLINTQLTDVENTIKEIMNSLNTKILSIPGIGYILGATIISEIGNISKFDSPKKLLAYAGLDPSVIQSGNFNATTTKISKRGSSYLRFAIKQAASLIIWNNTTFHDYYVRKMTQGKTHSNAVGHVSFKLTRVIFKILSENIDFNLI